jgi:DNA-binding NtrC family response regulator
LRVPSLNERIEDIKPLAEHFLQLFSLKYNLPVPRLSDDAIMQLQQYVWPGNIRELSHLMERLLFTCKKTTITGRDLLLEEAKQGSQSIEDATLSMEDIEQQVLINRLKHHHGNATETAKSLGLSRSGFYRRMSKYGLD